MSSISGWVIQHPSSAVEAFAHINPYRRDDEPVQSFPLQRVSHVTWHTAALTDQLRELSTLVDGWDGYGAAGIEARAVTHAENVLPLLDVAPDHLLPSSAGTILIEWETMLGRASLELGRDTFSFYTSPAVGDPILLGGTVQGLDVGDINFALATVAGKIGSAFLEGSNRRVSVEEHGLDPSPCVSRAMRSRPAQFCRRTM